MKVLKVSRYLLMVLILISCGEKTPDKNLQEMAAKPEFGKIISVETALAEFGPVLHKVDINSETLLEILSQSQTTILFKLKDSLLIANQERKAIFPFNGKVSQNDTFVVYYKAIVEELLTTGAEPITSIEKRSEKVTISNGANVLEYGSWCPPLCAPLTEK